MESRSSLKPIGNTEKSNMKMGQNESNMKMGQNFDPHKIEKL